MKITELIADHFRSHRTRSKAAFLWRISLEGLLVPLILALAVDQLLPLPSRPDLDSLPAWKLFVELAVFAPVLETCLFQALPVRLARALGLQFLGQLAFSVILFSAAHFLVNWSAGIFAGLLTGTYIAFTYVRWREESLRAALWMTIAVHTIHNVALFLIVWVSGDLRG